MAFEHLIAEHSTRLINCPPAETKTRLEEALADFGRTIGVDRVYVVPGENPVHEITFLTGSAFRDRIENSGAKFVSLQGRTDFDGRDFLSVAPELKDIPPGLEWFRVAIERIFVDSLLAQHRGCYRRWRNVRLT